MQEIKIYGLLGTHLGHSFSKSFFKEKFLKENINACYKNYELSTLETLKSLLNEENNLCGLNVTIPYKQQIIPLLDDIDGEALEIGAVNVIKIDRENGKCKLTGFNSDFWGFQQSIKPYLNDFYDKALVLGASGGAAQAVIYALLKMNIKVLGVSREINNDLSKWQLKFGKSNFNFISYKDLSDTIIKDYKIIINATPIGMYPNINEKPRINYGVLGYNHLLYDLIYNPNITSFLQAGLEKKARIKNGYEMLKLQALRSWDIWNSL